MDELKFTSNLFDDTEDYAKNNYWICFKDPDLYYKFKTISVDEKITIDAALTKSAREVSGDDRMVFVKYTPKNRLLFILYYMYLWGGREYTVVKEYDNCINDEIRVSL